MKTPYVQKTNEPTWGASGVCRSRGKGAAGAASAAGAPGKAAESAAAGVSGAAGESGATAESVAAGASGAAGASAVAGATDEAQTLRRPRPTAATIGRHHCRGSQRKSRSRSSPVRTGSVSPDGRSRSPFARAEARARSPSASPPPPRFAPPCLAPTRTCLAPSHHCHRHQLLNRRTSLSCSSAYFTLRPPAIPVRLVNAGAQYLPPPDIAPLGPCVPDVPPPPAAGALHRAPAHAHSGSCGAVRHLLDELVLSLPLGTQRPRASRRLTSAPHTPHLYSTGVRMETSLLAASTCSRSLPSPRELPHTPPCTPPRALTRPLQTEPQDCRSVAVQALAHTRAEEDHHDPYDESQKEGSWVGGVRALRDSHVRLVLRQLRHIERLNRALDRAASVPPPAAPASARLPRF